LRRGTTLDGRAGLSEEPDLSVGDLDLPEEEEEEEEEEGERGTEWPRLVMPTALLMFILTDELGVMSLVLFRLLEELSSGFFMEK
jgi:hypothetical protein